LIAFLALQVYYSRAVKGNVKTRADSIGEQLNTDQGVNNIMETRSVAARTSVSGQAARDEGFNNAFSGSTISNETGAQYKGIIGGTGETGVLIEPYQGGEVSSSQYSNATMGSGELGTRGVATMGNFTGAPRSAFNDSGVN
jgi:hypothetical protein